MKRNRTLSAFRLLAACCLLLGAGANDALAKEDLFSKQVAPILQRRCLSCHDATQAKGELSLETPANLMDNGYVQPGEPEDSHLLEVITSQDGQAPAMPKDGEPLSKEEVATIRQWIAAGAKWPQDVRLQPANISDADWWSLQPIKKPETPKLDESGQRWVRTPIDAFIWKRLAEQSLSPSPEADRRTLIRRLYFDLIGLPPAYEEIEAFARDTSPTAYEDLVDRLLASPRYGERWARHWLDVVHYGDTHGFDKDKLRTNAWPYRDYVIRSFNDDKPYAQFVAEQLAGDVLYPAQADGILALGFIAAGPFDWVGQIEVKQGTMEKRRVQNLDRDDMVATAMNTFVSTTVQCARCHNHKFDPVSVYDYYGLQAVFAGVDRAERSYNEDPDVHRKRYELEKQQGELAGEIKQLEDQIAANVATEVAAVDLKIQQLTDRQNKSSKRPEFGYHSAIERQPDKAKWVQVDLGSTVELNEVVLIACHDDFAEIGAGFGFPLRYRIELSDKPDLDADSQLIADLTQEVFPNPGLIPVSAEAGGAKGRYLRVTATQLAPRLPNDYIFAIAELQAYDKNGKNVAIGKPVQALDQAGSAPRWSPTNLTDGIFYSGGLDLQELKQLSKLQSDRQNLLDQAATPGQREQRQELAHRKEQLEAELNTLPAVDNEAKVFAATTHFKPHGNFIPTEGKPREIYVLRRGSEADPDLNHGPVSPRALEILDSLQSHFDLPADHTEGDRRAALAHWITDHRNPLTWRSIVNRLWQYHFGSGIVDSTNDFGHMGTLPTHPELLDWLASEFRDGGTISKQSMKSLHRLIVTSSVYRQSSASDPVKAKIDGANEYLWRMNRRKLEAEALRDSVLLAAGKLDLEMYGPGYHLFDIEKPQHSPHYLYETHDVDDPKTHRRTVYRFIVRSVPDPFLGALDCADPSLIVEKRVQTMTAIQALSLLNNKFMVRMSEHLAQRVGKNKKDTSQSLQEAFQLTLGRDPTAAELELLTPVLQQHGLANVCRVLLNSNEFVFVD